MNIETDKLHQKATQLVQDADAVAIFAGAGIGRDSGLQVYRGPGKKACGNKQ